ncbi:MAG TPA: hypothetical protein GX717_00065, partial [Clostridiaceae bacterium]|nr:hypothetical protein [Clostridiaceae bacterium]
MSGRVDHKKKIQLTPIWERIWLRVFLSIILTVLCFGAVKLIFGVTYAINDDIIMMEIASGVTTLQPDPHLIFIRPPLTYLIVFLFKLYGGFDWYAL